MKVVFVLFLVVFAVESRKAPPINKYANVDFINMESGGLARPPARPVATPATPPKPEPPKTPVVQPTQATVAKPAPQQPVVTPKPIPVAVPPTSVATPVRPLQPQPAQGGPNQTNLRAVPAKPAQGQGVTTPGYGSVKQLVNFYDSKGNASPIRPYSYSAAVKQG